jgi:hypothetical protein
MRTLARIAVALGFVGAIGIGTTVRVAWRRESTLMRLA